MHIASALWEKKDGCAKPQTMVAGNQRFTITEKKRLQMFFHTITVRLDVYGISGMSCRLDMDSFIQFSGNKIFRGDFEMNEMSFSTSEHNLLANTVSFADL